jgi:hypothetical protein
MTREFIKHTVTSVGPTGPSALMFINAKEANGTSEIDQRENQCPKHPNPNCSPSLGLAC